MFSPLKYLYFMNSPQVDNNEAVFRSQTGRLEYLILCFDKNHNSLNAMIQSFFIEKNIKICDHWRIAFVFVLIIFHLLWQDHDEGNHWLGMLVGSWTFYCSYLQVTVTENNCVCDLSELFSKPNCSQQAAICTNRKMSKLTELEFLLCGTSTHLFQR